MRKKTNNQRWQGQQHLQIGTGSRMDAGLSRVEAKLDGLAQQVQQLREGLEKAIDERLLAETYQADKTAIVERITKLESSPTRLLGWISAGIGCLSLMFGGAALLFTVITTLIVHFH